jgi:bla regulator protein blaR1
MDKANARRRVKTYLLLAAGAFFVACAANAQATAAPPTSPSAAASAQTSGAPAQQSSISAQAAAVTSSALPAWDVSTVKPASSGARGSSLMFTPDGISIKNVPLQMIVREAFDVQDDHLFNLPSWAKTSMFDIEAKVAPEDAPKLKDMKRDERFSMMIALLVERFGLKYHHETRELPVYDLVIAKGGVKMQASKPDPPAGEGQPPAQGGHWLRAGRGHVESTGTGMEMLARVLSQTLGRTVVDKTGLTGNYDYKLDWTPDDALPAMAKVASPTAGDSTAAPDTSGPSLFTAVEEQLGLKLGAAKGPADVIVIDQLQQPTAN